MNIVSFLNSTSSNNNKNISGLNSLSKIKSIDNYNQSKDFIYEDNNNLNNINIPNDISIKRHLSLSPSLIRNNSRYPGASILKKYKENYNYLINEKVIENTAFGNFPEESYISKQNINMNNMPNNNSIYNNGEQIINFHKPKLNESDSEIKIVEFNNIMMRSNNTFIDYRNINNDNINYNDYN